MKAWHAIVPLKQGTAAKSRLSGVLTPQQRQLLSDAMARHVLSVLERCHLIAELSLLAPNPLQGWQGRWVRDVGIGLNAALERWSNDQIGAKRLIIHADLPLLSPEDVDGFLAGAEKAGGAMATDRAGTGTNAMALPAGRAINFCFGPESRRLHAPQIGERNVLELPGVAFDIDTPDDLDGLPASLVDRLAES
jgi:2-phospho-L-lactate guanylyltransferase